MTNYRIVFARSARKELQVLDGVLAAKLLERIEALAKDPWPPGCRKLRSSSGAFRIRFGEYRVIYQIDDTAKVVDIVGVRHRRDAYR